MNMNVGQVITILGNFNYIYVPNTPIDYQAHYQAAEHNEPPPNCIPAKARGKLKLKRTGARTLVSVGDFVKYHLPTENLSSDNPAYIVEILERESHLCRVTPKHPEQPDIVISNCHQIFLVVSAALAPPLRMIDKTAVACEFGGLQLFIIFNKLDIAQNYELDYIKKIYQNTNITIKAVSAKTGLGIDELKSSMIGKTTGLFGLSGVGKSSIINRMLGSNIRIGAVDSAMQGKHTTTHSRMIPIPEGGWVVDTPGVKEFEIYGILPEELDTYFPDIFSFAHQCKFNNCQHQNEPKCAVINAVNEGRIAKSRYDSYLEILEKLQAIPAYQRGFNVQ